MDKLGVGLRIKPMRGKSFDVWGEVTCRNYDHNEKIYYCASDSFPEDCVEEVYTDRRSEK